LERELTYINIVRLLFVLLVVSLSLLAPYNSPAEGADKSCVHEYYWPECDDGNPLNGYWAWNRHWIPGYVSNATWFEPAPIVSQGNATFYAPWVMEATAEYRGFDLSNYIDGVALMSPADIGMEVWLKPPWGDWEGPFLVVDCARRGDIWPVINFYDEVVELGFKTAERWGMVEHHSPWRAIRWKEQGVIVSKAPPFMVYSYEIVDYPSWWLDRAEFVHRYEARPIYRFPSTWRVNGEWITFEQPQLRRHRTILPSTQFHWR